MKYFYKYLILFILFTPFFIKAQTKKPENLFKYDYKKFHFGFTLGFNEMNFTARNVKNLGDFDSLMVVQPVPEYGFNIGIVSSMRLAEYLDLRFVPTLSFGDRILKYSVRVKDKVVIEQQKSVESTYIDFPLTIKYKSKRLNNMRMYLLGGMRYSIDLASQSKKNFNNQDVLVKIQPSDYSLELGTGVEFYLRYFKFGTEIKMAYGLRDLLKREDNMYTNSIDKLTSKIFWITFTFE